MPSRRQFYAAGKWPARWISPNAKRKRRHRSPTTTGIDSAIAIATAKQGKHALRVVKLVEGVLQLAVPHAADATQSVAAATLVQGTRLARSEARNAAGTTHWPARADSGFATAAKVTLSCGAAHEVRREVRAGYGMRATGLRGCGLWAVGCGLWAMGYGLWAMGYEMRDAGCGMRHVPFAVCRLPFAVCRLPFECAPPCWRAVAWAGEERCLPAADKTAGPNDQFFHTCVMATRVRPQTNRALGGQRGDGAPGTGRALNGAAPRWRCPSRRPLQALKQRGIWPCRGARGNAVHKGPGHRWRNDQDRARRGVALWRTQARFVRSQRCGDILVHQSQLTGVYLAFRLFYSGNTGIPIHSFFAGGLGVSCASTVASSGTQRASPLACTAAS